MPVDCPSGNGWIDVGAAGCFYMNKNTQSMSWEEARTYCKNLGSGVSLAEIHNENTQNSIITKAQELGIANMENSGWWLGSNQINDAINWKCLI